MAVTARVEGMEVESVLQSKESYVRLMFWGGAGASAHNNTFEAASINVARSYSDVTPIKHEIDTTYAKGIVKIINSQKENSIQSIDFFTHGGPEALYFKGGKHDFYRSSSVRSWSFFSNNSQTLDDVKISKFTNGAKVEMHGCNSAGELEEHSNLNFAKEFSKKLYAAKKKNAVVIGHVTAANPNGHSSLKGSDYRHGSRRVYHNGAILFNTKKEGAITASDVNKYLEEKEKQGKDYDWRKIK